MKNYRLLYKKESPYDGEDYVYSSINFNNQNDGWEKWSLPIGNGYMGVNVFGRVKEERLQITENSFSNPYAKGCGGLINFLDLYLDFPHSFEETEGFTRDLLLNHATAGVGYMCGGVSYKREYFTSYPDRCFVSRITASEKGMVSFSVRPVIPFVEPFLFDEGDGMGRCGKISVCGNEIIASGVLEYYDIKYEAVIKVVNQGGELIDTADGITVKNADAVTVFVAVGTNYKLESRVFDEQDHEMKLSPYPHPHELVKSIIDNASAKGNERLKLNHEADFSGLFERCEISFGGEIPDISTDEMLYAYREGKDFPYLEELYFEYGRYLLISSSRPGTYPANLQGTWTKYRSSPWSSGYWHNINVQMNYWPAFNTNLIECFEPYVAYNKEYMNATKRQADMYIKDGFPEKFEGEGKNGWYMATAGWLYDFLAEPPSQLSHSGPGTVSFTSKLFWEYFDFTQDMDILKNTAYPALKGASKFLLKVTEKYGDLYLSKYSASPEQFDGDKPFHGLGVAFDQQFIYENHSDVRKCEKILGVTSDVTDGINEQIDKLDHVIIGKSGQVKEFR